MNSRKTYRVFISSTYLNNQERRKLVEDAVLRADMQPVGMEHFTADAHPALDVCQGQARDCDVYVGIIAHRYGWIPEGQTQSITELEYAAAKTAGKPRLMFDIDRSLPVYPDHDFDAGDDCWDKQKQLQAFRATFRADQTPTPFQDDTLGMKVLHALNRWREKREGTALPMQPPLPVDIGPTAPEIERYRSVIANVHAELELAGFEGRLRVSIDLEELFVPLHAMLDLRSGGDGEFADADDAETRLREHGAPEIPLSVAFRAAGQKNAGAW